MSKPRVANARQSQAHGRGRAGRPAPELPRLCPVCEGACRTSADQPKRSCPKCKGLGYIPKKPQRALAVAGQAALW